MFGLRRHAAPPARSSAPCPPRLSDEQTAAVVAREIAAVVGRSGDWCLVPRNPSDTDVLFSDTIAASVTARVTGALGRAQEALEADAAAAQADDTTAHRERARRHAAERERTPATPSAEPAALGWRPAPISRWADAPRPATGPEPITPERLSA